MSKFQCSACDRTYQWKSEFAGKRTKCKCGEVISVPTEDPGSPIAPSDSPSVDSAEPQEKVCPSCDASLSPAAKICRDCGYSFSLGKKMETVTKTTDAPASNNRVKNTVLLVSAAAMIAIAVVNFMGDDLEAPPSSKANPSSGRPTATGKDAKPGKDSQLGNTDSNQTTTPPTDGNATTHTSALLTNPRYDPGKPETRNYTSVTDTDPADESQPYPWQPSARPYKLVTPTRTYPPVLEVTEEDLPAKLDEIITALNVRENHSRNTTGELLARLPIAAVPLMKKALELDDLTWIAEVSLNKGLELIDRRERGKAMTDAQAKRLEYARNEMVRPYMNSDKRDPKWDDFALEGLDLSARLTAGDPTANDHTRYLANRLLTRALVLGCKDAMVQYWAARHYMHTRNAPPVALSTLPQMLISAAQRFEYSNYSNLRKGYAYMRATEANWLYSMDTPENRLAAAKPWLEKVLPAFDEACKSKRVTERDAASFGWQYIELMKRFRKDHKYGYDLVKGVLDKHFPDSAATAIVRGKFLNKYAWDARGSGWASSVTEQGWKDFNARLTESMQVLGKGWRDHPDWTEFPEHMLTVGLGVSPDVTFMEKSLRGALLADPNNQSACMAVSSYLMPRWHGSLERQINFCRQCLLTGNWDGYLPSLLLYLHYDWARTNPDGTYARTSRLSYFNDPVVWKDVEAVCEGQLKWRPNDRFILQRYAYAAIGAEKWDVAHRCFEAFKGLPNWNLWQSKTQFESMRELARKNAKEK